MGVQLTYIPIQDQQIVKKQDFFYIYLLYGIEGYTLILTHVSSPLRSVYSPDFAYN